MRRFVHTMALAAALTALGVSIWRGAGPWAALKRAGIAYLGIFVVFAVLALAYRAGVSAESRPAVPPAAGRKETPGPAGR